MANFHDSEYFHIEASAVVSICREIFEEDNWSILETTDSSITAKEGLLAFLTSGPVTMVVEVSTEPRPGGLETVVLAGSDGCTRVDAHLSCLGLGPINKRRLVKINSKFWDRGVYRIIYEHNMLSENEICKTCGVKVNP